MTNEQRALILKHPIPWIAWSGNFRPNAPTKIVEVVDANGETVLPWSAFDHLAKTPALALARSIAKCVNEAM